MKKAGLFFVLLSMLWLTACAASAPRLVAQGNQAFAEAAYDEAFEAYTSAQEIAPESGQPVYNMANTRYRQEAYDEAGQWLQQAIGLAKDELAQYSFYNLGNTFFQQEQWTEAIEAYKEALRRNPDDVEAKYNLELAWQQQDQQEQQEQQQEQDQEQEQQQDESQSEEGESESEQSEAESQPESGQNEEPADSQPEQGDTEQESPTSDGQPQPLEGLTEAQARQLLDAIGKNAETLQERLQQIYVAPGPPPGKDW